MVDDMAVYIANLGKYNEGCLVGAWFTFPIDEEDVKEKIGLNEQYEEYAIHDTDNFPIAIGEYVSIEELNEMYEMIEELPDYIVECRYHGLRIPRTVHSSRFFLSHLPRQ